MKRRQRTRITPAEHLREAVERMFHQRVGQTPAEWLQWIAAFAERGDVAGGALHDGEIEALVLYLGFIVAQTEALAGVSADWRMELPRSALALIQEKIAKGLRSYF